MPDFKNPSSREEPERVKSSVGSSAAQSRRAKNAAHRADDVGQFFTRHLRVSPSLSGTHLF